MERTLDFQIRLDSPHDCVNLFLYNTVCIVLYGLIPLYGAWAAIFQYINDIHINRMTPQRPYIWSVSEHTCMYIDNINRDRT